MEVVINFARDRFLLKALFDFLADGTKAPAHPLPYPLENSQVEPILVPEVVADEGLVDPGPLGDLTQVGRVEPI